MNTGCIRSYFPHSSRFVQSLSIFLVRERTRCVADAPLQAAVRVCVFGAVLASRAPRGSARRRQNQFRQAKNGSLCQSVLSIVHAARAKALRRVVL